MSQTPSRSEDELIPQTGSSNNAPAHRLSRRVFMSSAAAGATTLGIALNRNVSGQADEKRSGRVRWRFEARRIETAFRDGTTLPFFRYVSVGNTRSNGNLPLMQDFAGRKVSVSVKNSVDFPIQPMILDHGSGPVIMPGETGVWKFTMPPPGTWMFSESLLGNAAGSAGFAAAMISNSTVWRSPIRDYYLLYQDADDRWNNAIDNGQVPDESVFQPNYHTINGLSFPESMLNRQTRVSCRLGQDILLRFANLGNIRHSLHLHGYHAQLIRRNNVADNSMPPKDTFALPAYSTMEVLLHIDQVGEYPLHPHALTATTDNGLYQGGSVTMIDAVE